MCDSNIDAGIISSVFQKFRTEIIPVKCPLCGGIPQETFPLKGEIIKCEWCAKGYYKLREAVDEKSVRTMISSILNEFSSVVLKGFEDKMSVKLQDILYDYYQTFQLDLKNACQQEGKITREAMEKLLKNLDNRVLSRIIDIQEGVKDIKRDTEYVRAEIKELREHFRTPGTLYLARSGIPRPRGKREDDITEEDLDEMKFT